MPQVITDKMVEVRPEDKILIKKLGYKKIAKMLGLSPGYIRFLASNGPKKRTMRYKQLIQIRQLEISR